MADETQHAKRKFVAWARRNPTLLMAYLLLGVISVAVAFTQWQRTRDAEAWFASGRATGPRVEVRNGMSGQFFPSFDDVGSRPIVQLSGPTAGELRRRSEAILKAAFDKRDPGSWERMARGFDDKEDYLGRPSLGQAIEQVPKDEDTGMAFAVKDGANPQIVSSVFGEPLPLDEPAGDPRTGALPGIDLPVGPLYAGLPRNGGTPSIFVPLPPTGEEPERPQGPGPEENPETPPQPSTPSGPEDPKDPPQPGGPEDPGSPPAPQGPPDPEDPEGPGDPEIPTPPGFPDPDSPEGLPPSVDAEVPLPAPFLLFPAGLAILGWRRRSGKAL